MTMKKTVIAILIFLCGSLVFPAVALPAQVYAPYIDVALNTPDTTITSIAEKTGVKYFTLAFVNGGDSNEPMWAWRPADGYYRDQVDALRAMGGDVIISFGGAVGAESELARKITDLDILTQKYQSVIDAYDAKSIDFDIEGSALTDPDSIDRRNQAIKRLQDTDPDLYVSYTLPVVPAGLAPESLNLIKSAKDTGVRIDRVNVMLMDYGDGAAPDPDGKMGYYGIEAAKSLFSQLKGIYPDKTDAQVWQMIGLTPMIGQNDVRSEVFYLEDARQVAEFAGGNGVGLVSIWSAHRDNGKGGRDAAANWGYSGIEQEDFAFSNIFEQYASMKPSATPAPAPRSGTVWPDQVCAPYIDYGLWQGTTINEAYDATGVKYYTCCFITVNTAGELRFADHKEADWRLADINALRAKGGDVILSFGGAGGEKSEPAIVITDLNTLVEAYSSVIDTYGVNYIDFDIEGWAVTDPGSNNRRNQAIIRLKEKYPDLKVSTTLAVSPADGFNAFALAYLNDVKSAEDRYNEAHPGKEILIFDRVNLMLMDYGPWYVKDPDQMGEYGIDAANAVHGQLKQGYYNGKTDAEIWKRMGLTPMIGQNDAKAEIFYQKDARQVAEFAGEKGIGLMSIWSLSRDQEGCDGQFPPSSTCSSIPQEKFEFTNIIKNYPSMRPSATETPTPTPTPTPTYTTGLITPTPTHATGLIPKWISDKEYDAGDTILHNGVMYAARWWTMGEEPGIEYVWLPTSGKVIPKPDHAKGLISEWNKDSIYVSGDSVLYDGGVFSARWLTMGEKPGVSYVWELISEIEPEPSPTPAAVTPTETPATGLIPKWDSKTEYNEGDTVIYKGNSYTARWWNVAEPPVHTYSWISDSGKYVPTPVPAPGPARQWVEKQVYAAGDTVIYKQNRYRASWINRNEIPGESYVWELAPEEPTPVPTSSPTPVPTSSPTPAPTHATGLLPQPTHAKGLITPTPTPATGLLGN